MSQISLSIRKIVILATVILPSSLHASFNNNSQEEEITFKHINSISEYHKFKYEIKNTNFNPPLNEAEKLVIENVRSELKYQFKSITKGLTEEEAKLYYEKSEQDLKNYPVQGTWIVEKKGKFIGKITLVDHFIYDSETEPGISTITTEFLEREQSTGAGTKARKEIYKQISPFLGKEVKLTRIKKTKPSLTPEQTSLPKAEILKIKKNLPFTQQIEEKDYIFVRIKSDIFPHNNYGSLISQIRAGAVVYLYSPKTIQLTYPPLDASILNSDYPRIEELRNIVSGFDKRETRETSKQKYEEFFSSLES